MEKYGFVYIWRDKKHKRYYIGCHWGTEDDGYICSSRWMRKSYRRRPNDFKRRILSKICTNRLDLLEEEYKWICLIKEEELGKRYYNLRNHHPAHWSTYDDEQKIAIIEKISQAGIGRHHTDEAKKKISEGHKGQIPWCQGKKLTDKQKENIIKGRFWITNGIKNTLCKENVPEGWYKEKQFQKNKKLNKVLK